MDWLFSRLYIQKVHLSLMNFYPRNVSSKMQLKKFMTRRELTFFFPRTPLFASEHGERCTKRSLGLRATDHSQLHPLHEMHSHTHASHTGPSRRTLTPTSTRNFPTDGTNAFSQLDVRIRSAHLRPCAKFALETSSRSNVAKIIEYI